MTKKRAMITPNRGEIFLVNFDPTTGAEIKKTRPALIVQNDIANQNSPIMIVAAITSQFEEPLYPTEVRIRRPEGGLSTNSVVLLNQIRSIDKRRLVKRMGTLRNDTMAKVNRALLVSLGLAEI
jgi:mRNA interferase MazF